jgi:hypothetical protein
VVFPVAAIFADVLAGFTDVGFTDASDSWEAELLLPLGCAFAPALFPDMKTDGGTGASISVGPPIFAE